LTAAAAFHDSEDEDDKALESNEAERAAPKPTLRLSSLPSKTSRETVKALVPEGLTVNAIAKETPSAPSATDRISMSFIVTFAKDTPLKELDAAVNALQGQYLGEGFYLTISRHLSSSTLGSATPSTLLSSTSSHPFGAKQISTGVSNALNRAPPPHEARNPRFAPPESYIPEATQRAAGVLSLRVPVAPPLDVRQLKLIHKTVENLLEYGPEFEAVLMSRLEVQHDEKWAWLWDARSIGGIWYRWKLWQAMSGHDLDYDGESQNLDPIELFEQEPKWMAPEHDLQFEFVDCFEDFVED